MRVLLAGSDHAFIRHVAEMLPENVRKLVMVHSAQELEAHLSQNMDIALISLLENKSRDAKQVYAPQYSWVACIGIIKKRQPLTQVVCLVPENNIALSIAVMKNGAFAEINPPFSRGVINKNIEAAYREKARQRKQNKLRANNRGASIYWMSRPSQRIISAQKVLRKKKKSTS